MRVNKSEAEKKIVPNGSTQIVFELIWKYIEKQNSLVVAAKIS